MCYITILTGFANFDGAYKTLEEIILDFSFKNIIFQSSDSIFLQFLSAFPSYRQ